MSADDPVMLVTGATGGIGFEIAAQAAAEGWVVGVHGSTETSVANVIARIRERFSGAQLVPATADYSHPEQVSNMVACLATGAGRLDAVVDCAMLYSKLRLSGPFSTIDPAVFGTSGTGAAELQTLCHAVLPYLVRSGGAIVAFSSDSGRFAAPLQSGIAAKQGAIMAFVRSLALEMAREGVRVNCISPSFVEDTPIFERISNQGNRAERARRKAGLGLPTPADIAPLALFLCGPGSQRITGQIISVNGGLSA